MSDERTAKHAPDPLLDEVRAVRKELSEQFGNDVGRLCEYLREVEVEHEARRRKAARVGNTETKT